MTLRDISMAEHSCEHCNGEGWIIQNDDLTDEFGEPVYTEKVCSMCDGQGFVYD